MQTATMIPVESSMFSSIGFDAERGEILTQYRTGTLGGYSPATRAEFDEFLGATSIGQHFNTTIKRTKHFRKVEERESISEPAPKGEIVVISGGRCRDHEGNLLAEVTGDGLREQLTESVIEAGTEQEIAVKSTATDTASRALSLQINSPEAHKAGQEIIIAISDMRKQVTEFFKPMKDAAHKAHKAVCDRESEVLAPLADAQKNLSGKLVAFERAAEEERQCEQQRLAAEARERAEAEAKAEAERLAIEDAIELEEAGDVAAAEAVLANPVPVPVRYTPPPVVASTVSKVAGAVKKETWRARVVNVNLVPREWMVVDQAALDKFAANRKSLALVPGVEFYSEESIHGRSRAR